MKPINARRLEAPVLESKPLSSVCDAFVGGDCPNPECPLSHEVCLVLDSTSATIPVVRGSLTNYLSLAPRVAPFGVSVFDDDGPGSLSVAGPRHDNDHVEVQNIHILPTTDEVSPHLGVYPKTAYQENLVDTLLTTSFHAVQGCAQPAVSSTWNGSFDR